ncbi:MAG TPA: hypothetical protein ENL02_03735 [Epsilonproteobacteria bacterium]|nr:hypothetical protein [Campylobacterota bacterium]
MKTLIAINTYNSASLIRTFAWDYILFTRSNPDYDFVVSLDGPDPETIDYCEQYGIPLLYSEKNEGVGLSKNRVIESFPDYDYYFFIEDDAELLNPEVFAIHIALSQRLNIPHFSLFDSDRIREVQSVREAEGYHIIGALYGGAPVNFFTREGLEKVGGFHTDFAKYKRFGHTEHSYRFYRAGLTDYPFQIIQECIKGYFGWHNPVSRVKLNVASSANRLFVGEEELIAQKLTYFPLQTLSPCHSRHLKNVSHTENILIDADYPKCKARFYRKMARLDKARALKAWIKSLVGKTRA